MALRYASGRKDDPRRHLCDIPETFYTDHDCDLTSRHIEQFALGLTTVLDFFEPGLSRGLERIERFSETINLLFLCMLPECTPNGVRTGVTLLTLPQPQTRLRDILLEDYHRHINVVHSPSIYLRRINTTAS